MFSASLWISAGCLVGGLLGLTLRKHALPVAAPQATQTTQTFLRPTPPPRPSARIWYSPRNYSHLTMPNGQQEVVRSVLNITGPMQFGDFVWNETGIPQGPVWVRIDLGRQLLSVFRGGHEIGTAVILYGSDGKPTPIGSFTILQKDADHYSHSYDAAMPYMLRLTNDGVAIHGSNVREGWATHGCIGVPLDFARLLFAVASKGDPVVILAAGTEPQGAQLR